MTRWRLAVTLVLLALVGVPLAMPLLELAGDSASWQVWSEPGLLARLALNSLRLIAATLLAVPVGVFYAVLIYRTDVPLRSLWRFLVVLALFVPLPLLASAWQATLGSGGLLPTIAAEWFPGTSSPFDAWNTRPTDDPDVNATGLVWKPWAYGLPAAAWVHAVAALPWVILIVGHGLRWVEPELEEEALLNASPARVLLRVTLPRSVGLIAAAALWVALQAATEITITDMMQVRTFAEEVYFQFVLGDRSALARGVAINLPVALLVALVVLIAVRRLQATVPSLEHRAREPVVFALGPWMRWMAFMDVALTAAVLAGVPIASLVWKAGSEGGSGPFAVDTLVRNVVQVVSGRGGVLVVRSLLFAAIAGSVTALVAFVVCWFTTGTRAHLLPLLLASLVLALPGPILGLGLKASIELLMNLEDALGLAGFHPARALLYQGAGPWQWRALGPWPVPQWWIALVRFFPFSLAVLWPVIRLYPAELRESAQTDGASPGRELWSLALPLLLPATLQAALGVAVLSLGEVSAGKLVEIPGATTFAHELFNQMHYGVQDRLAALCLVLLLTVAAGGSLVALVSWWMANRNAPGT